LLPTGVLHSIVLAKPIHRLLQTEDLLLRLLQSDEASAAKRTPKGPKIRDWSI
jgi:hypothetical protein